MKKRLSLLFTCFVAGMMCVNAQVTIGTNNDPHAGAVLDLQSTNKGLLLPNVSLNNAAAFQLSTKPADAASGVGMIVFNINADMTGGNGIGVYVWDGAKWMSALGGNTKPEPEPNPDGTVDMKIGNNIYKTYDYNGTVWMVENSMEGTSTAQIYDDDKTKVNGYYYTHAQAVGACPSGWHLPTSAEWYNLQTWVNANLSQQAAQWWVKDTSNAFAGYSNSSNTWSNWGSYGRWWSAGPAGQYFYTVTTGMHGPGGDTAGRFSVRCVQN